MRARLGQDLQRIAAELWQLIQDEHAVVGQRHLARPGEVPAADQPHIGDRLRRGATRTRGDQRRAGAGGAGMRWICVVSRASARRIAGRSVVSRRASTLSTTTKVMMNDGMLVV